MRTHPAVILALSMTVTLTAFLWAFVTFMLPSLYTPVSKLPCSAFVQPAPKGCHR